VSELQQLAPLRARLAAVFGVSADSLLPVRGYAHAVDIVSWSGAPAEFINEVEIDWFDDGSRVEEAASGTSLIVYREIGAAYGAETPLCGALIAAPETITRFAAAVGGDYLHPLIAAETLKALAPPRLALRDARIAAFRSERARLVEQLARAEGVRSVMAGDGRSLTILADNADAVMARAAAYEASLTRIEDNVIAIAIGAAVSNDRALAAFGSATPRSPRIGETIRETKETKVVARVDLNRAGDVRIKTGAAYFDHMLEQIAAHGGISLTLACEGDVEVDLHHTIEDCALALGEALSKALGERRGISRYGFTLPMDEAEARVSIDLGGRPYAVFEGAFAAPLIGQYPTEMTAHVFRSLAQSMGAAIHVAVKGENDHHKTEACFKAFARALRAAIAVEGDAVPSTKGAIL
jgi:imidazoleglycerol phosphate dehydratase HisB